MQPVNSRALQIAGINDNTPDTAGGQIQREFLLAMPPAFYLKMRWSWLRIHSPETVPEIVDAMRDAQQYCWQVGLTGIHDFGRSCFLALQSLHANRELGLRLSKNIPVKLLENAVGWALRSGFGDEWLRIGGIKIFADGALGPRTAAMVAPYDHEPDNLGIMVTDKEEMQLKPVLPVPMASV